MATKSKADATSGMVQPEIARVRAMNAELMADNQSLRDERDRRQGAGETTETLSGLQMTEVLAAVPPGGTLTYTAPRGRD